MSTSFDADMALRPVADGVWRATMDTKWWVGRGPHGGYLAGLLMSALIASAGDGARHPRTLSVHFLAPPGEGEVEVAVQTERRGRTRTSLTARMTQGEQTVALAIAEFISSWDGPAYQEIEMPQVEEPSEAPSTAAGGVTRPPFFDNFDARWAFGDIPFSGGTSARSGGWIRLAQPRTVDATAVAVLMDAWPPAIFSRAAGPLIVPTVDFTVHFRVPLPHPAARPDDFYLVGFRAEVASDGFFVEDGEMWARDGTLLAQSRQLAVIMSPG